MTLVEINERFGEVGNAGHIAHVQQLYYFKFAYESKAEDDKIMTSFYLTINLNAHEFW